MAFNKYMHPRNKYRIPPDFKQLSAEYPEFRKHIYPDLSGKLKFNFQNQDALRILTTTLLRKDFGLNVDIPACRLVPTLPLRLNYILWIEDLLNLNAIKTPIHGIDIGTGASCIYPLLACKDKGWRMLAVENDTLSAETAVKNVKANHLSHLISVKQCSERCDLDSLLNAGVTTSYHFTMCNPPFFAPDEEVKCRNEGRRPPPKGHNVRTGGVKTELEVEGGEVEFMKNIVRDNVRAREKIKIFTTMLGHKSSVKRLTQFLTDLGSVQHISHTEFCQGNTMRWGVAWTFDDNVRLKDFLRDKQKAKSSKPLCYAVEDQEASVESVVQQIFTLCDVLKIIYKILRKNDNFFKINMTAYSNTWTNQRRLKRRHKQLTTGSPQSEEKKRKTIVEKVGQDRKSKDGYRVGDISDEFINNDEESNEFEKVNETRVSFSENDVFVDRSSVRDSEEINEKVEKCNETDTSHCREKVCTFENDVSNKLIVKNYEESDDLERKKECIFENDISNKLVVKSDEESNDLERKKECIFESDISNKSVIKSEKESNDLDTKNSADVNMDPNNVFNIEQVLRSRELIRDVKQVPCHYRKEQSTSESNMRTCKNISNKSNVKFDKQFNEVKKHNGTSVQNNVPDLEKALDSKELMKKDEKSIPQTLNECIEGKNMFERNNRVSNVPNGFVKSAEKIVEVDKFEVKKEENMIDKIDIVESKNCMNETEFSNIDDIDTIPVLICNVIIENIEDVVMIEVIHVAGSGSKDLSSQLLQYFKNHLNKTN